MDVEFEDTNTMNWAGQILMVSTHFAWLGEEVGFSPVPPTGPGMWHRWSQCWLLLLTFKALSSGL